MDTKISVEDAEVEKAYKRIKKDAEENGYFLNNDLFFSKELIKSLLINQKRYGYESCPCRLASGEKAKDLDIICPCDYRDADLNDYGACYCALYVSSEILEGKKRLSAIPERRNPKMSVNKNRESEKPGSAGKEKSSLSNLSYPVWRCKVCGYLCARDNPPEICPICKAKKERFEKFL
ncbi:ferredoxin:glutaredoxin reductase [bacterium]|nr:ferredoxin:glutaredoxin reductase [bacterium]